MNSHVGLCDGEGSRSKRCIAYSLAAGAVVVTGNMQEADAEIVYSGIANLPVGLTYFQPLNFDGDATGPKDLTLKNYVDPYGASGYFQGVFSPALGTGFVGFKVGTLTYATALNAGFEVNTTNTGQGNFTGSLAFGGNHPNAQFNNVVDKFIGFSFASIDGDPRFHHGWVRVSIDNTAGSFIIRDWAWERELAVPIVTGDTGIAPGDFDFDGDVDGRDFLEWQRGKTLNPLSGSDLSIWQANYGTVPPPLVATTAVPEPATLGLLAAGSAGILCLRRLHNR